VLCKVIQKLRPSLQAPYGPMDESVKTPTIGLRSAAFQTERLLPLRFVTSMRSPSNAAVLGVVKKLPVSVARTAPFEARTTDTELDPLFGTQIFQ